MTEAIRLAKLAAAAQALHVVAGTKFPSTPGGEWILYELVRTPGTVRAEKFEAPVEAALDELRRVADEVGGWWTGMPPEDFLWANEVPAAYDRFVVEFQKKKDAHTAAHPRFVVLDFAKLSEALSRLQFVEDALGRAALLPLVEEVRLAWRALIPRPLNAIEIMHELMVRSSRTSDLRQGLRVKDDHFELEGDILPLGADAAAPVMLVPLVPGIENSRRPEWKLKLEGRPEKLAPEELALTIGLAGFVPPLGKSLNVDLGKIHVKITMPDGHSTGMRFGKD